MSVYGASESKKMICIKQSSTMVHYEVRLYELQVVWKISGLCGVERHSYI